LEQITLLEWKNAKDAKAEPQITQSIAFPHSLGRKRTFVVSAAKVRTPLFFHDASDQRQRKSGWRAVG
jgi:hypothetical protein